MSNPSHSLVHILARAVLWCLILAIIVFTAFYVYVRVIGKPLLENVLSVVLERPTTFRSVRMALPYDIVIEGLSVPQVVDVKRVILRMTSFSFSDRQLIVKRVRLQEPVLTIRSNPGAGFQWGDGTAIKISPEPAAASAPPAPIPTQNPFSLKGQAFLIRTFEVERGTVRVLNKTSSGEGITDFQDLMLKMTDLSYPLRSYQTRFELTARIKNDGIPFSEGQLEGKGWLDLVRKNMDGSFRMARSEGSLVLSADVRSRNNEMTVTGQLDIQQIGHVLPGGAEALTLPEALGQAMQVGLKGQYSFQTRMDDFKIGQVKIQGVVESPGDQKDSTVGTGVPAPGVRREAAAVLPPATGGP